MLGEFFSDTFLDIPDCFGMTRRLRDKLTVVDTTVATWKQDLESRLAKGEITADGMFDWYSLKELLDTEIKNIKWPSPDVSCFVLP